MLDGCACCLIVLVKVMRRVWFCGDNFLEILHLSPLPSSLRVFSCSLLYCCRSAAEFRTGASISGSNPIPSVRQWTVTPVTAVWCGTDFKGRHGRHRGSVKRCIGREQARCAEIKCLLTERGLPALETALFIRASGSGRTATASIDMNPRVAADMFRPMFFPTYRFCGARGRQCVDPLLLCERKTSRSWLWQRRRVDGQSRRSFCIF